MVIVTKQKKFNAVSTLPVAAQIVDPQKIGEKPFYNMPDSAASNLIFEMLQAGENIADLPARKQKVSHGQSLEVRERGNQRQVIYKSGAAEVTVELEDIGKLTGSNKPAKKLFVLTLIKANEQAIFSGEIGRDYVSFPLQELIDIGFYKTSQSARQGFKSGAGALTSLKIKGHIQKGKRKKSSIDVLEVLFTGARIEKNQCTIYLNPRIDWGFMTQYFTLIPKYYFRLPNRSSDLLYYIFFIARQRTADIEQRGYFTISFRAIQAQLQLPNELSTPNPQRDIKNQIEKAIEEIEDQHSRYYSNTDFSLLPVYDDKANIKSFLDNGYLQVSFKNDFAQTFIKISQEKRKQIEATQKRSERITEKAIALKAAQGELEPPVRKESAGK